MASEQRTEPKAGSMKCDGKIATGFACYSE